MKESTTPNHAPSILCLDDEEDWLEYYEERFSQKYTVKKAKSLLEAEKILESPDVKFALVDISLIPNDSKDTGGFKFLDKLQSLGLIRDLPTVIITSIQDDQNMRKAFTEYGVKDVFYKKNITEERIKLERLIASEIDKSSSPEKIGETPRVLVVDDEPDWQELLREIFEAEGCQVDVAASYQEAVDKILNASYHLATIDIRLDNINHNDARGLELLEMAKRFGQDITSIVISAVATSEQIAWAMTELRALDFIDKSKFKPEKFRRQIRAIFSRTIYINVDFPDADYDEKTKIPVFKMGNEYQLLVSASQTRSRGGFSRTVVSPMRDEKFELETVVHPYDIDIMPGSTQYLSVNIGGSQEPCVFSIRPKVKGQLEISIDYLYRTNPLARMIIKAEAIE